MGLWRVSLNKFGPGLKRSMEKAMEFYDNSKKLDLILTAGLSGTIYASLVRLKINTH